MDSIAGDVEASQQAIRDLLHRLSLSGVLEELGRIFSGHDPVDDVKRVANDIKAILHTLSREADGSSSLFQAVMSELDTLTTQFETWTRKEFTHLLGNPVGNAVADLYNSDVDLVEGGTKSLLETVGSLGDLATHPQQLGDLLKQANPEYQIANFVADPKGAFEHNLNVVKGLVDAKDWNSDHPFRGLGDNIGTGLQFLIPGAGEAKAGAEGAWAADEAAQAAKAEGKAADGLLGRRHSRAGTRRFCFGAHRARARGCAALSRRVARGACCGLTALCARTASRWCGCARGAASRSRRVRWAWRRRGWSRRRWRGWRSAGRRRRGAQSVRGAVRIGETG